MTAEGTTRFTPGPWEFSHRAGADGDYRTEVFSKEHGGIASCAWTPKHCGNGVTETYREANARLIAAAPDLVFHLLAAANYVDALGGDSRSYRAAIARATLTPTEGDK